MELIQIKARDLPDAWFQALYHTIESGRIYTIDNGSFKEQQRLELDYVTIHITQPGTRPLLPEMPAHINLPPPVTEEYLNSYVDYIMGDTQPKENEVYTYATFIVPQMKEIIKKFKQGYNTNQATITVGNALSIHQEDPPCLKLIDCQINNNNKLNFIVYFRSNDLWSGFPANLAGLQYLKEYMASEIGVEDGEMIYSSKGLHLYDYTWPLATLRLGKEGLVDGRTLQI